MNGYTALHYYAYDGNMKIIPLLVQHGANVNAKDGRGVTPLISAAKCDYRLSCDDCSKSGQWKAGALPTIKFLVSKGASLTAKDNEGKTALDMVSKSDCPLTYAYLKAHGVQSGRRLK